MTDWVRLWHDMPTDPKWRVIAKRSGRTISEVIAVFTFVMVNASGNATKRGVTHNLFHDDVAAALDIEIEAVDAILKAMTGKVITKEGALTGWEKRQPKREDTSSTKRVREWRERNETKRNAEKRPETETETETEKKECLRTPARAREAFEAWNSFAGETGLPVAQMLTNARRSHLDQRLAECGGIEGWRSALEKVRVSAFLNGGGERGWKADLDFVLQPKSFAKIMEGSFDDRKPNGQAQGITAKLERAAAILDRRQAQSRDEGRSQDRFELSLPGKAR